MLLVPDPEKHQEIHLGELYFWRRRRKFLSAFAGSEGSFAASSPLAKLLQLSGKGACSQSGSTSTSRREGTQSERPS